VTLALNGPTCLLLAIVESKRESSSSLSMIILKQLPPSLQRISFPCPGLNSNSS
jgi:hypothetical protein